MASKISFLNDMNIPYTFKRSLRARHMRISIYPTGEVQVVAPRLVPEFLVRKFVAGKEGWITQKVAEFKARPIRPQSVQWGTGTRREYLAHKKQSLELVSERVRHFAGKYGVTYGRIAIRNQKTRWGSCTKKGNLSFSYRIAFLPSELQDYLIVHEVCHIKEFNHSRAFWELVAKEIPEYRVLRKRLRGIE